MIILLLLFHKSLEIYTWLIRNNLIPMINSCINKMSKYNLNNNICFSWFQTNELVMSLEDDEKLILRDGCRLQACGVGM